MTFDLRRPNCFTIDLQVVADNARAIRAHIGPQARFTATVKADAYGFGLVSVARAVLAAGADSLSVVRLEDAVALRDAGIACPVILYAGYVIDDDYVRLIERYDLTPTIHDRHALEAITRAATRRIGCAVKVECGQERLGVRAEDLPGFVRAASATGRITIDVINAHPHVIDGNLDHLRWQFERFAAACRAVQPYCDPGTACIFASSRVLAAGQEMQLSGVDPGQALFQLPEAIASPEAVTRTPFLSLSSRLIHTFEVRRTAYREASPVPVGPGARIGIVPIGYGDGLVQLNAGMALVRGRRVPLASAPSVEYARLDLSSCPDAVVGDEVMFVGRQGSDCLSPQDVMRHTGIARVTNLALQVGRAIPRRYLEPQPEAPRQSCEQMELAS
jgi:alanine racemase